MMKGTRKKIEKILSEIEQSNNSNSNVNKRNKMTTSQVVDIILNKNIDVQSPSATYSNKCRESGSSAAHFNYDMNELALWRERNNQLYKIGYYREIYSNRKYFGKFIVFFKRVVRRIMKFLIEPIINEQNDFNGSVTASINALYNNEVVTSEFIKKLTYEKDIIEKELKQIKNQFENQKQELDNYKEQLLAIKENQKEISNINTEFIDLKESVQRIIENNHDLNEKCVVLTENIIKDEVEYLENKIQDIELNFLRSLKKYQESKEDADKTNIKNYPEKENIIYSQNYDKTFLSLDYFKFENHFRGSRKNIKESQKMYVDYFIDKALVLDLGCGRGEFLELLKENGINAIGIDLYEEFVDYCNINGLEAIHADAVSYLHNLDNNSIGGIFAAQFVEHLETNQLIQLCNDAYNKLMPGSNFIIETPNPTSLAIYTNWFYVDPTHIKPIHPKTLEYFLQQAGFRNIKIIYISTSKVDYKLPLLEGENIKNLDEFNKALNHVSDILFGCQDYAVIAQK